MPSPSPTLRSKSPNRNPPSQKLKLTRQANALEIVPKDTLKVEARKAEPVKEAAKEATLEVAPETKTDDHATRPMAQKADDIWLRAVMLAPDLQYYLSATLIGAPDPKELRPLMLKPTFGTDHRASTTIPPRVIPTDRSQRRSGRVPRDRLVSSTRTASLR